MRISHILESGVLPSMELEVMLAELLHKDRSFVIAHPEYVLTKDQEAKIEEWGRRRLDHEPLAYITERKEFYGREFTIDKRALIPRPSTEGLIEVTLQFLEYPLEQVVEVDSGIAVCALPLKPEQPHMIVDMGTGSGCIAVTLACEIPDMKFLATDMSKQALNLGAINAMNHGVEKRITFQHGDLLEPAQTIDVPFLVVSNPPYIPVREELMPDVVNFEPKSALFAGEDGMEVIRPLLLQAKAHPMCVGVILECRMDQVEDVKRILSQNEVQ